MDANNDKSAWFTRSSALFDRNGALVSWDSGFALEFTAAADVLKPGVTYYDIIDAVVAKASQFRTLDGEIIDADQVRQGRSRNGPFGTPRSFHYLNADDRVIRVEETISVNGDIFRVSDDATEEWRAKQELAEAKRRLALADHTPASASLTFTVSPDGQMKIPSPSVALKRLHGLPDNFDVPDPMALYSRVDMTAEEHAANTQAARRCMETLEPYLFVYRIRDLEGNPRWIHNSLLPRREPDGTVVFEGSARDITSERLTQEQIELLRAVVVQSSDSVIIMETDAVGNDTILYLNPAFERLFGRTLRQLAGKDGGEYSQSPIDVEVHRRLTERLAARDTDPLEFQATHADGRLRWVEARICMLQEQTDGVSRWAVISRDVSERRRVADELERSRQSLADAQRMTHLGNWSWDLKTDELYWSEELYRLFGLDPAKTVPTAEMSDRQTHPEDLVVLMERIDAILAGPDRSASCDYRVISGDTVRILHGELNVIVDEDDNPIRMVGTAQDITEKRRARAELERSEQMLAEAQRIAKMGSWEADLRTGDLRWSDGFYNIIGLDPAEHAASVDLFLSLVHPDSRDEFMRKSEIALAGDNRYVPGDYRIVWRDGTERFLHAEAAYVTDQTGRAVHAVGMIQDVTVQREAKEELLKALELAKAGDRAKSEFLANMSHELRTPLNAIIGFSEFLLIDPTGFPGTARQKEYLEAIYSSGQHLLDIINGILNLSKIEAGQTSLDEALFELPEAVDWSLRCVREEARTAGVTFEVDVAASLPTVRGDSRLVRQAMLNLISNALKFTPSGGWVRVRAKQTEEGDMLIAVADSGIGMTPEGIAVALTPFGQVDSSIQRKFQGTGLGLPLAKKFIELHGGELAIESAPGQGTTVTITLPRSRCEARPDLLSDLARSA